MKYILFMKAEDFTNKNFQKLFNILNNSAAYSQLQEDLNKFMIDHLTCWTSNKLSEKEEKEYEDKLKNIKNYVTDIYNMIFKDDESSDDTKSTEEDICENDNLDDYFDEDDDYYYDIDDEDDFDTDELNSYIDNHIFEKTSTKDINKKDDKCYTSSDKNYSSTNLANISYKANEEKELSNNTYYYQLKDNTKDWTTDYKITVSDNSKPISYCDFKSHYFSNNEGEELPVDDNETLAEKLKQEYLKSTEQKERDDIKSFAYYVLDLIQNKEYKFMNNKDTNNLFILVEPTNYTQEIMNIKLHDEYLSEFFKTKGFKSAKVLSINGLVVYLEL